MEPVHDFLIVAAVDGKTVNAEAAVDQINQDDAKPQTSLAGGQHLESCAEHS